MLAKPINLTHIDDKTWSEFSDAERSYAVKQAAAPPVSIIPSATIVSNLGRDEVLAGFISKWLLSAEDGFKFCKLLKTTDNLKGFANDIIAFVDKGTSFQQLTLAKVKDAYSCDSVDLLARLKQEKYQIEPVTPRNFGEQLASHSSLKTAGVQGTTVNYQFGKLNAYVNFGDNIKAFAEAKTILQLVEGTQSGIVRRYFAYDPNIDNLVNLVALRYDIVLEPGGLLFTFKGAVSPLAYVPSDVRVDGEKMTELIKPVIFPYTLNPMPLEARSSSNICALLYAAFMENKILDGQPELSFTLKSDRIKNAPRIAVVTQVPDGKYDLWVKEVDTGNVDHDFDVYKEILRHNKEWEKTANIDDMHYHDLMVNGDYIHLPHKKWGNAHFVHLAQDLVDTKLLDGLTSIMVEGSRSVDLARSIPFVPKLDTAFTGLAEKVVYAGGTPSAVDGWQVHAHKIGTPVPIKHSTPGKLLYLISDFLRTQAPGAKIEELENITRVLSSLPRPRDTTLVVGYNIMQGGTLNAILTAAENVGMGLKLWKHPRLQNDAVYLIFDAKIKVDFNLPKQMFGCRYISKENIIRRASAIWLGFSPVKAPGNDVNVIFGLYATMHLTDLSKAGKAGLARGHVPRESKLFKILKDNTVGLPVIVDISKDKDSKLVVGGNNNNNVGAPDPKKHKL